MKRHYYVTNDWDDLKIASTELSRRDIFHTAALGASCGVLLVAVLLTLTSTYGWAAQMGWASFILLSIALFVFSTWEGGLCHQFSH